MLRARTSRSLTAAFVLLALVGAACADDGTGDDAGGDTAATTESAVPTSYAERGPFAVGELDLELDPDHRVAVFYPVDPDAVGEDAEAYSYSGAEIFGPDISSLLPGALAAEISPEDTWVGLPASGDGPFPIVLHSHGAAGNLRFANLHNAHTASWGNVVVVVDHPERGVAAAFASIGGSDDRGGDTADYFLDTEQLFDGLDLALAEGETDGSPVQGALDADRVAAEGHSAGGSASGAAAYDERIDLWLGQAPGAPIPPDTDVAAFVTAEATGRGIDIEAIRAESEPPDVESLIIAAEGDSIIDLDESVLPTYEWLAPPKRLAVIAESGHAVFVDPCKNIRDEGGLSSFVEALGVDPDSVGLIELGENGCLPEDTDPTEIWPLIDHLTAAQLEATFGDRPTGEASLDETFLDETFPGLLAEVRTG